MNKDLKIAILIDADNISDKYVKIILGETAAKGVATYKRMYGDWTRYPFQFLEKSSSGKFHYSNSAVQLYHWEKSYGFGYDY